MDRFLSLLKKPQQKVRNEEKLKFCALNVSMWDYFSMAESSYKSLTVEEKTSLLNKYYSELDDRYYGKTGNLIFILSEILKIVWFLYMFLAFLMILRLLLYFFIGAANSSTDNSVS